MNKDEIMRLADAYARAAWGESDEQHEARAALEAALTEKQEPCKYCGDTTDHDTRYCYPAPEAKQEPVAWVSRTGHGTYFRESLSPELEALEFGGNKMWTPLYTADQLAGAVLRERERCAKICDAYAEEGWSTNGCAAAIRSNNDPT